MAVFAQSFATSGFSNAGFKGSVKDEEINSTDIGFRVNGNNSQKANNFSTKSNIGSIAQGCETISGHNTFANTTLNGGGFATGGFANSELTNKELTQSKSLQALEDSSSDSLKNQIGSFDTSHSQSLFKPKFSVSTPVDKIDIELVSTNHSIEINNEIAQKYCCMDTSDDFSAAELPLRYDALMGSYCTDTCMEHTDADKEAQDCPQCCLSKYTLKIGSGRVELLKRDKEDSKSNSVSLANEWQKKYVKSESTFFVVMNSPY